MKTKHKTLAGLCAIFVLASQLIAAEAASPTTTVPAPPADANTRTNPDGSISMPGSSGSEIPTPDEPRTPSEAVFGIPRAILDKMPPGEVANLAQRQAELRVAQNHSENTIIPIVAIAFTFGMPIAIVAIVMIFRHRRKHLLHQTLRAMIDKGVAIPPELLRPEQAMTATPGSDFRRGLLWIAVGTGLTLFLLIDHSQKWPIGLIPLLIGAAFLVTWKVEGSKRGSTPS